MQRKKDDVSDAKAESRFRFKLRGLSIRIVSSTKKILILKE